MSVLVGKEKESLAEKFLLSKKYSILAKNFRYKKGEIDLIAKIDEIIVFVEVKYRKSTAFGFPEATVTAAKQDLIQKTSEQFMAEQNWNGRIRFDIIAISGEEVMHFEDCF